MAEFELREVEGMRYVRIGIRDETVRAESGALSHMEGRIRVEARIPSLGSAIKSALSDEAIVRPSYTGTGVIHLEASLGGYHVFEVAAGESWILENGAYWASEGSVRLGLHREPMITSFWAGEGLIDYQTKVTGPGRVVLNAQGPVEEIALDGEDLAVEGKLVIARTEGLQYRMRRATSLIQHLFSGEPLLRSYRGRGRALVSWTPYWNRKLVEYMLPDASAFTASGSGRV